MHLEREALAGTKQPSRFRLSGCGRPEKYKLGWLSRKEDLIVLFSLNVQILADSHFQTH